VKILNETAFEGSGDFDEIFKIAGKNQRFSAFKIY